MIDHRIPATLSRRHLIQTATIGGLALPMLRPTPVLGLQSTEPLNELTILLPGEPPSLDPALTYDVDGWSIVHAVYDSLVTYNNDGELVPLLAESWEWPDPLTLEFRLREGVIFHNGEPLDSRAVAATVAHILDPETASQVAQNFAAIDRVEEVDALTVRFHLSAPAPALLVQVAASLAIMPPSLLAEPDRDINSAPIGTGPYRFVEWNRGESVVLERNLEYPPDSPKGFPLAERVTYRFVGDASTRVAELRSGGAEIVRGIPQDQVSVAAAGEARVISAPVSGLAFIRIATDVAPFDDVRVRRALNYAVDVEGIIAALLDNSGEALAALATPTTLGYDPDLTPYPYDPVQARELLAEAGFPNGFETTLEVTTTERLEFAQAIAGMLEAVGIRCSVRTVDRGVFNETWRDPESAPLRFLTWRPMFDPFTLLGLMIASDGFLSRFENERVDDLIVAGAVESDPEERAAIYRELWTVLHEEPAAMYLWSLTSLYGVADEAAAWTPRADEYILPMA